MISKFSLWFNKTYYNNMFDRTHCMGTNQTLVVKVPAAFGLNCPAAVPDLGTGEPQICAAGSQELPPSPSHWAGKSGTSVLPAEGSPTEHGHPLIAFSPPSITAKIHPEEQGGREAGWIPFYNWGT